MASAGQLKSKIDAQKKKIVEKGKTLSAERQRQLRKRLKRLQRSRRVAARASCASASRGCSDPAVSPPAPRHGRSGPRKRPPRRPLGRPKPSRPRPEAHPAPKERRR